jgi:S1-C subfamily serine protease
VELPTDGPADDGADVAAGRHVSPALLLAGLGIVAALGGGAYWLGSQRSTVASTQADADPEAIEVAEPEPAADREPDASPERRAWDAQAAVNAATTRRAAAPATGGPSEAPPSGTTLAVEDMVDRALPAIVLVETSTGRGSAFFVRHDTLITNVHVVKDDDYVTLRKMDGSSLNARVETRAPAYDIAVLRVGTPSAQQATIAMGSAQALKPGQEVIVIGSALGTLQNSVSRGIVSGLRHSGGVTLVQTDAAANPGNSGGPMLDRDGRVVGVTTAGYRDSQGINFAVAIDHAKDILEGRQATIASGQRGLGEIQSTPSTATTFESDRRLQQGQRELTARLDAAAKAADQLDDAWQRYRDTCHKSAIAGRYDREWFVVFTRQGLPADTSASCGDYYRRMTTEMQKFRAFMRDLMDSARRAGVLPGTVRDALRSKRLTYDWDL